MKKSFLACLLIALFLSASAQDVHNSQFFNAPLNLSPALTGVFNGNQRLTGNYNSQWASVPVDYTSFIGTYDQAISNKNNKSGYFSLGASLLYDQAGEVDLNQFEFSIATSYSYKIDDKSMITPGFAIGVSNRHFDSDKVITANQWDGERYDANIPAESFNDQGITFIDFSAGLNYHRQNSYRQYMDVGLGVYHLGSPTNSFNESALLAGLTRRYSAYAMASLKLGKNFDLLGNAVYSTQSPHQEILFNGQIKIYLSQSSGKKVALFLGVGVRLEDALYPMIAVEYQNLYVGFNYDMNYSELERASDGKGGPELSFRYLFYKLKKAPFKPCPIY